MSGGDPLRAFDGFVQRFTVGGAPTGPLAGMSFVAKDLYDVRGYPTGAGNPDWERTHPVPARRAPAIERLLAAGATLAGKSCSDELAFSLDGINVHYGTPRNPRFPDRLPGGSSSGSVSAVAAGLVDFALGTDTSGSIRVPASYCGVYGFRPTHGVIPMDGVVPLAPSFDTVGWLARDARMLARCGRVLLGAPERGPDVSATGFSRLGLLVDAFALIDERYRGAVRDAVASMRGAFAEVREVHIGAGGLTAWFDAFHALKQWEAWRTHGDWIRSTSPRMADSIRANFERASRVTDAERSAALGERERLRDALRPHLAPGTALCLPTAWTIAPLKNASAEELATNRRTDLALGSVSGILGAPQVSIPIAAERSAIGLSLIAPPGEDLRLLGLVASLAAPGSALVQAD